MTVYEIVYSKSEGSQFVELKAFGLYYEETSISVPSSYNDYVELYRRDMNSSASRFLKVIWDEIERRESRGSLPHITLHKVKEF